MNLNSIKMCTNDLIGENSCIEGINAIIWFGIFVGLMIGIGVFADYINHKRQITPMESKP